MVAAMDEDSKWDEKFSMRVDMVKQVVKQLFGSMQMAESVQAVVPRGSARREQSAPGEDRGARESSRVE